MTKIISRPDDQPAGEGEYLVRMDFEQLQYIGALVYNTRLGTDPYKEAAFRLVGVMDELFGNDFLEDASRAVNMAVSIEDHRGNVIEQHGHDNICIEV